MEHTTTSVALPVMEAFYTLQGEGVFQGHAAWFVRLGGCDVGCVWCDVKESWNMDAHPRIEVSQIVSSASAMPGRIAVITGGEPCMHQLDELTAAFKAAGFRTHIETSGAHPLSGQWDWICLSPKKFKPAREEFYAVAQELKVVVYHRSDLAWAEEHAARVSPSCALLLQPEWEKQADMMPLIIEYVKAHPRWRISLQTHKFMDIP